MRHSLLLVLFLASFWYSGLKAAAGDRPNVVLIMTDDQGYGDFGVHGNPIFETPHLDAMASRSASMSTFYVCPVCAPTRAGLMTGRYNYRTRAIDTYIGRAMMDPEEVTLAEVLSAAGYATGIFGKWHLGDCYPLRPMEQGFQESLVHRGGGLAQPSEPRENGRRYTNPILFHNGEQVRAEGYCTDVYFEAAINFIEESRSKSQPFFAYIPTNAPHSPFHDVPEDLREYYSKKDLESILVGRSRDKSSPEGLDHLARIAAMITNVDQNVGRLFAKLDALGLTENTLVIFLVDNGPNSQRFVGPYRGSKTDVLEGGIRSPLWLHWPARLGAGTSRDELSAHIDVMPTILEACQVLPPDDVALDGRSFLSLLEGKDAAWPERTIATQWHRGDVPTRYRHFMIRDSRWKLLDNRPAVEEELATAPEFELYDLQADPGEKNNLIDEEPEVFARLKQSYDEWFDDVSSTRPDNYAPPRIILGSEHEISTALTRQDWRGSLGWQSGAMGHWSVHVAQPTRFDFEVILDTDSPGGVVELRLADVVVQQTIEPGADRCEIQDVLLPVGDAKLQAVQLLDGKQRGVYQVIVTARR
ncbi:MAG: arylsulfatase [Planctomycetales bacterium]|nr:arylsulfatase [Planctomycetales bacterium]